MSAMGRIATQPAPQKSSGPVQFDASEDAIFDSTTNRTYQLIERRSDSVPHCASRAGNHAAAMLGQLNASKALSYERTQLQSRLTEDESLLDTERTEISAQIEQIGADLKELPSVEVQRADRAARLFWLLDE